MAMAVMVVVPAEITVMAAGSAHASIAPTPVAPVRPAAATVAPAAIWKTSLRIDVVLIFLFHEGCGIRHLKFILFSAHLQIQRVFNLSEGCPVLDVATMTCICTGSERATSPMRAFAILGVEPRTLIVFIACGGTVWDTVDLMVVSIMCKMSIRPHLDPLTTALAWLHIKAFDRVA